MRKIKLTLDELEAIKQERFKAGTDAYEQMNKHIEAHKDIVNEDNSTKQPGTPTPKPNQEFIDALASQIGYGVFKGEIYIPGLKIDDLKYICNGIATYLVNNCITILEPQNGSN